MANQGRVGISRIYVKDLSFELPSAPEGFKKQFQPEIKVDVAVRHSDLKDNLYEVCIETTVTGTEEGKKVFVVEVEQAGLFLIENVESEQMNYVLKVYCPNILFPYVRQTIDNAMVMGTLPPLHLLPFNFEV